MESYEDEPFCQWACDECGATIDRPLEGWVEWRNREGLLCDFRVVHHIDASPRPNGCYGSEIEGNMLLESALGSDGLAALLGLLDRAKVQPAQFAEFVRRLHIPFYENARAYRVDPALYEINGVREYTQAGILAKLRLPAVK